MRTTLVNMWVVAAVLLLPMVAMAGESEVVVPLGGVRQVPYGAPILRISSGNPNVAEISPLGTDSVLIKGKKIGETTVMIWGRDGGQASVRVSVQVDGDAIQAKLSELFPGQKIQVVVSGATVMLRGTVTDLETLDAVHQWLKGYKKGLGRAGSGLQVVDRLTIPGKQQVLLHVKFAEVERTALRKLGINIFATQSGHLFGLLGPATSMPRAIESGTLPLPGEAGMSAPLGSAMDVLFLTDPSFSFPFHAILSVLSRRSLAKTLSEPTLVAMSGQKASFLVGGEFPVTIPMGLGQPPSVEYKPYGVQLHFTPVVLRDETLQVQIQVTESSLDWANATVSQGDRIPSLISRSAQTTVRLRSGQTFAIAGLMSDSVRSTTDKVPLLGDVPVLGMLFRSQDFKRVETELVVVVTARLVSPTDAARMPALPGEGMVADPNDFELFLMGWGDRMRPGRRVSRRRPAGRVGYRK